LYHYLCQGLIAGNLLNSGVTLDAQGDVYGTTWMGGARNSGTVYRLTHSGSGWTEDILYSFTGGSGRNTTLLTT